MLARLQPVSRSRDGVRVLGPADRADFLALAALDPVVNVFADYRARSTDLQTRLLGGEIWGRYVDDRLVAGCHVGANLVPVGCSEEDARVFGERARVRPRTVVTIVGPEPAVATVWDTVQHSWPSARECRWGQPHLEIAGPPSLAPDPAVRPTTPDDLDLLYPACVAMYTEEVGADPEVGGSAHYRARVRQLIGFGWSFARIEHGRVVFKAEVASVTPYAAQVQGVWVAPERRGEGIAGPAMAAVVEHVRRSFAPTVSLYVNEWNEPARRTYASVGFRQTATFATIML